MRRRQSITSNVIFLPRSGWTLFPPSAAVLSAFVAWSKHATAAEGLKQIFWCRWCERIPVRVIAPPRVITQSCSVSHFSSTLYKTQKRVKCLRPSKIRPVFSVQGCDTLRATFLLHASQSWNGLPKGYFLGNFSLQLFWSWNDEATNELFPWRLLLRLCVSSRMFRERDGVKRWDRIRGRVLGVIREGRGIEQMVWMDGWWLKRGLQL